MMGLKSKRRHIKAAIFSERSLSSLSSVPSHSIFSSNSSSFDSRHDSQQDPACYCFYSFRQRFSNFWKSYLLFIHFDLYSCHYWTSRTIGWLQNNDFSDFSSHSRRKRGECLKTSETPRLKRQQTDHSLSFSTLILFLLVFSICSTTRFIQPLLIRTQLQALPTWVFDAIVCVCRHLSLTLYRFSFIDHQKGPL